MKLNEIKSKDWQLSSAEPGAVVEGVNDVAQCIILICTTVKGSDPLRPDFGTAILQYQDKPVNLARPAIIKEVIEAVSTYETRAELVRIETELDAENMSISVFWRPSQTNLIGTDTNDRADVLQNEIKDLSGIGYMVIETTFEVF